MRRRLKPKVRNFILLLLVVVFLFSIGNIIIFFIDIHKNNNSNKKLVDDVITTNKDEDDNDDAIEIDFDKLLSINESTKGWITYNQNKINYPIVQADNNKYYLTKSFEKKTNQAGAIFMDYRNKSYNDKNVVLYGHAMTDNSMFGSLKDLFKNSYFDTEENNYIKIIDINNDILTYQIFSYYITEKEEYYITTNFDNDKSFQLFINTISKRNYGKFDVDVTSADNILTLSTCYGTGNTTKRKVVHAKLIKKESR